MIGKVKVDANERRRVLKTLVAAGGATALAAVSGHAVAAAPEAAPAKQPVNAGYRETDHIRTYYEKARF